MIHTPGEWIARKDPDGGRDDYAIGTADGKIDGIAVCGARDAPLISAAPRLLAFACAFEAAGMDGIGDFDVHALICDATTLPPNYCSAAKNDIAPPSNPPPKPRNKAE